MNKKLYRDEQHKTIGGVCAGLADYFGTDVSVIRLIFLLALIFKGGGFLIYIILWIVLPRKAYVFTNPGVDYVVPPQNEFEKENTSKPRRPSQAGTIGGMILILLGIFLLFDELDIIPNVDFGDLWPVILIIIGIVFIFTHKKDNVSAPKPPINEL